MLRDFFHLFFPSLCTACSAPLVKGENYICTSCRFHLPKTGFHLQADNPVMKRFWGRIPIEGATAYYYFHKGEKVQQMIHRLKYRGDREIGVVLGKIMASDIKLAPPFDSVNAVIPVPLHRSKLLKRGYNQSDYIAQGITEIFSVPLKNNLLQRLKKTATQTKKSRFERFENVNRIFDVKDGKSFSGKHFLLVDDVITTGSTLIACAEALLAIPGSKVSIAAAAYAHH